MLIYQNVIFARNVEKNSNSYFCKSVALQPLARSSTLYTAHLFCKLRIMYIPVVLQRGFRVPVCYSFI